MQNHAVLLPMIGPTSDAGALHSLRVYHATQAALGNDLDPMAWGFKSVNGLLMPIKMESQPAPEYLLRVIRS